MIKCKKNWLQLLSLGTRKINYKDKHGCPKYENYTKMTSSVCQVSMCKTHLQNAETRQNCKKSSRLKYEINSRASLINFDSNQSTYY